MFVRLLKGPQPSNILLITLFSTLLWLKTFMIHDHSVQEYFAPFIEGYLNQWSHLPIINSVILFGIIIFEAFYMIRINLKYIFIESRTYFPALIYILWITLMLGTNHFNAVIIANLFTLFAIEAILKIQIGKLNVRLVYKAGLLIGVASLFYWPSILIIIPIWIFTLILHGINWRGLVAQLIGALTPWMFVFFGYFLINQPHIYQDLISEITTERTIKLGSNFESYKLYFIALIILSSSLYHFNYSTLKKIIVRKYYSGMMWFIIIITAGVVAIPSAGLSGLVLIGLPATLFLSNQLLTAKRSFFVEISFALLLAAAIFWVIIQ